MLGLIEQINWHFWLKFKSLRANTQRGNFKLKVCFNKTALLKLYILLLLYVYLQFQCSHISFFDAIILKIEKEHHELKSISSYVSKNGCEWDLNPCPHHEFESMPAPWVRIPFAAIFVDITRGWFKLKLITSRLLFSNMIWRLSSLANRTICLTV